MVKKDTYLGSASQQNALFFEKCVQKNAPMPTMSRIGIGYRMMCFSTDYFPLCISISKNDREYSKKNVTSKDRFQCLHISCSNT